MVTLPLHLRKHHPRITESGGDSAPYHDEPSPRSLRIRPDLGLSAVRLRQNRHHGHGRSADHILGADCASVSKPSVKASESAAPPGQQPHPAGPDCRGQWDPY